MTEESVTAAKVLAQSASSSQLGGLHLKTEWVDNQAKWDEFLTLVNSGVNVDHAANVIGVDWKS
jgi:hypothetical protein